MTPDVSLIWAMDEHGLIGRNNALPWRLPADMQWFRQHTLGKPVLMGRKTFESIGKSLPERRNLILTHQQGFTLPGCDVVHSLDQAIRQLEGQRELMVIGGAQVYQLALPKAQRLYVTRVHAQFEGDAWFPDVTWALWEPTFELACEADERNAYPYSFTIYERRRAVDESRQ